MELYAILAASLLINGLLIWYLVKLLKKFIFISANIADLFLITKSFEVFVSSVYSMDNYHGEPIIRELIFKMRQLLDEMEDFREIFQYMLDEEIEEELDAAKEENEEE